jgi:hypothetical protein
VWPVSFLKAFNILKLNRISLLIKLINLKNKCKIFKVLILKTEKILASFGSYNDTTVLFWESESKILTDMLA